MTNNDAKLLASYARVIEARRVARLAPDYHSVHLKNYRNETSEPEMKAMGFMVAMCSYDDATVSDLLDMRWKSWMDNKQA